MSAPEMRPVPRGGDLPASFAQERVWRLAQADPESLAHHSASTLRVRGALDAAALEAALTDVVERHEIFRTTFHAGEDGPVQRIHPPAAVHLPVVDLSRVPEGAREETLAGWMETELARNFRPDTLPLARWTLVRLATDDHLLLGVAHHLVDDGWSADVVFRDLLACYWARLAGTSPDLPILPVQFADFAGWQREWLRSPEGAAALELAKAKLRDAPPALDLPLDRPRQPAPRLPRATVRAAIPGEVVRARSATAEEEGAASFTAMMAGFAALLARLTGARELAVGTAVAARRPDVGDVVGPFGNELALRFALDGDPPFRTLLRRVRAEMMEADAHRDVPSDAVAAALRAEGDDGRCTAFQAMLSLRDSNRLALELPGATAELSVGLAGGSPGVDLSVVAVPGRADGGVELAWEYDADLFDAGTIERMAGRYVALLAAAASDPGLPLSRLPLLDEAERRALLEEWNDTTRPYPRESSIPALFAAWAARTPEAEAVVHGGERVTYGELEARANRLAHHLRARGAGRETPVAVLLDRSAASVAAYLGVLKAGGAYLPIDPAYPPERIGWMLEDSRAPVIVTTAEAAARLPALDAAVVCVDADADAIAVHPPTAPAVEVEAEGAACVIYTSGSTGRPKGIVVTHRGVARLAYAEEPVRLGEGDRVVHASNVAFDVTTWEVWGPLLNGGTVVVADRETALSADALAALLRDERVTTLFLTTALFGQVAREAPDAFRGVREVLFGGEAADAEALRRVQAADPARRLVNAYGPAENTTYTASHVAGAVPPGAATVPIGRPVTHTRVYVLDAALQLVPPGSAGELCAGGDGVARGYLGRPALTAERFVPDPFSGQPGARMYRTGDRARWREVREYESAKVREWNGNDGSRETAPAFALSHSRTFALDYLGRLDQQVKVRGFRVEPGEIEAALREHPSVADAAVIAREDRPGDRRLVAYVVAAAGAEVEPFALRAHLAARLPEFMVPAAFVRLARIPVDANGKVDRRALPAPDPSVDAGPVVEPRTELERRVAALWAEVLGTPRVGTDVSFFDLGGHSLLLMRLHPRLVELAPGAGLTVLDLFRHPTVASVAARLRGDDEAGDADVGRAGAAEAQLGAGRERLRARRMASAGERA
jgi:amino acid adenylation domain-containing protein